MADLPPVNVHASLMTRLRRIPDLTMTGCLYGLPAIPPLAKTSYQVWSGTGRNQADEPGARNSLEILNEVVPAGMDPLGIFLVLKEEHKSVLDKIHLLLAALPENFLNSIDPVVITRLGENGPLKVHLHSEGELKEITPIERTEKELLADVQLIRVKGNLHVETGQNEMDLQNAFRHLIEKVACPYGTFRLKDSDVFFLHIWRRRVAKTGWAGDEAVAGADEEQCQVTNLDDDDTVVSDLWKHVKEAEEDDEDDGFGVGEVKKESKSKQVTEKESMDFQIMLKMSGDACSSRTLNCSPVFHYEKRDAKTVRIPLKIDALAMVRKSMKIPDMMVLLKGCVQRQIHEMGRCVLSELKMRQTTSLPEVYHFKPEPLGHMCTIVYNKRGTCANFAEFRKHIHGLFMLPVDRPLFRRMNRYVFPSDRPTGSGPLLNVHEGLKSGSTGGKVHLVQGNYAYHHYMQDKFDDDGWGCAYRSLQTLISWFRLGGYAASEIPTHAQIQKCLVDIGDKEKKFINSKQWIGSTEVGFVLEKACGVTSKILSVSSGEELASKGRELAHHFDTNGTPVMIGGGVLAHTILGVEWNESTGDIKWLILDPHFTGSDWVSNGTKSNVALMQQKGWVGWKGPDFWKKDAFYNMCMPQKPLMW